MMNDQDSNMAANAVCHAAVMAQESIQQAMACQTEPSVLYKPRLFPEGDQWCALFGVDLQSGVCGFGASPADAMSNFNANWYSPLPARKGGAV